YTRNRTSREQLLIDSITSTHLPFAHKSPRLGMFVSLIVLNYNGLNVIDRCLRSLVEQNFPKEKYEILIVDNASTDGSLSLIQKNFGSVRILRSDWNQGYAGGANFGALHSKGDVLVFLNNDVKLSEEWLKKMTVVLEQKGPAIVGSKIFL